MSSITNGMNYMLMKLGNLLYSCAFGSTTTSLYLGLQKSEKQSFISVHVGEYIKYSTIVFFFFLMNSAVPV